MKIGSKEIQALKTLRTEATKFCLWYIPYFQYYLDQFYANVTVHTPQNWLKLQNTND